MARYIDIEPYESQENWVTRAFLVIENDTKLISIPLYSIPTADVVKVVRCKDCLWRHDDSSPMWLPCMERETPDNWWCADGERRTE